MDKKQIEFASNAVFDGLRAELKIGLQNIEQRKKEDESMKSVNPNKEYDINHMFSEVINTLIWAFEKGPVGTATVLDVLAVLREQDENFKKLVTEKDLERISDAVITGVWHVKEFLSRQEKEKQLAQEKSTATTTADEVKGEVKTALHLANKTFIESISLKVLMTPKEAAETLAKFHNVPVNWILDSYINLERAKDDQQVQFSRSISNGNPCIIMEGFSRSGSGIRLWSHLINEKNGQPIPRTS